MPLHYIRLLPALSLLPLLLNSAACSPAGANSACVEAWQSAVHSSRACTNDGNCPAAQLCGADEPGGRTYCHSQRRCSSEADCSGYVVCGGTTRCSGAGATGSYCEPGSAAPRDAGPDIATTLPDGGAIDFGSCGQSTWVALCTCLAQGSTDSQQRCFWLTAVTSPSSSSCYDCAVNGILANLCPMEQSALSTCISTARSGSPACGDVPCLMTRCASQAAAVTACIETGSTGPYMNLYTTVSRSCFGQLNYCGG